MQPILFPLAGPHRNLSSSQRRGVPPPMTGYVPLPAPYWRIAGITRDSTGAPLGGCVVHLLRAADDMPMDVVTSDATTGAYEFRSASLPTPYYLVAYHPGSPDVAGTTVNTLTGS